MGSARPSGEPRARSRISPAPPPAAAIELPATPPLHVTRLATRWGDQDALGHVNNATYLTYLESARIEWLEAVYPDGWPDGEGPILATTNVTFRRPIHHPAEVEVRVWADPPGRSSLRNAYAVHVAGEPEPRAVAEAVLVWVSTETGRPVRLPDAVRAVLPSPGA